MGLLESTLHLQRKSGCWISGYVDISVSICTNDILLPLIDSRIGESGFALASRKIPRCVDVSGDLFPLRFCFSESGLRRQLTGS